jgi:hypothetical protein
VLSLLEEAAADCNEQTDKESDSSDFRWTLVHSFYVIMGGFVMDTNIEDGIEYIPGSPRLTLTARGVKYLAENGHELPYITEASIKDRSKADGLAKGLVCLQAIYMISQCASRLANELPLTPLEVNTLGHVLCALVMYMFWLRKPQDVRDPTLVTSQWVPLLCAASWSAEKDWTIRSWTDRGTEYATPFVGHIDDCDPANVYALTRDCNWTRISPAPEQMKVPLGRTEGNLKKSTSSVTLPLKTITVFPRYPKPDELDWLSKHLSCLIIRDIGPSVSDEILLKRISELKEWNNIALVFRSSEVLPSHFRFGEEGYCICLDSEVLLRFGLAHRLDGTSSGNGPEILTLRHLALKQLSNWPDHNGLTSGRHALPSIMIIFATCLYGALHVGAWNSHFPTILEVELWRSSAVVVAASGTYVLTISLLDLLSVWLRYGRFIRFVEFFAFDIRYPSENKTSAGFIFYFVVSLCILGRLFFVIEAFISFRDLPVEVYQVPAWTQWFPHL